LVPACADAPKAEREGGGEHWEDLHLSTGVLEAFAAGADNLSLDQLNGLTRFFFFNAEYDPIVDKLRSKGAHPARVVQDRGGDGRLLRRASAEICRPAASRQGGAGQGRAAVSASPRLGLNCADLRRCWEGARMPRWCEYPLPEPPPSDATRRLSEALGAEMTKRGKTLLIKFDALSDSDMSIVRRARRGTATTRDADLSGGRSRG
jgi:hypothetical protein